MRRYFKLDLQDSTQYIIGFQGGYYRYCNVRGFAKMFLTKKRKNQFEIMGHSGSIDGFASNFFFRKKKQYPFGIIIMVNTNGENGTLEDIANTVLNLQLHFMFRNTKVEAGKVSWSKFIKRYK